MASAVWEKIESHIPAAGCPRVGGVGVQTDLEMPGREDWLFSLD